MPTPIGHALAGLAAGWIVAGVSRGDRRDQITQAAWLASFGMAADLDLLIHWHSGPTHSLGAAALAGIAAAIGRVPIAKNRSLIAAAAFAAWATHPLLDALALDTSPPIGVMAFWPVSHQYFITGLSVFMPIWRDPGSLRAVIHDILAVARELVILAPVALLAYGGRRFTA